MSAAIENRSLNEYCPIEFLLSTIGDLNLVSWLTDQVGVLRSVFKIASFNDQQCKEILYIGETCCKIERSDYNDYHVTMEDAINYSSCVDSENNAKCFHLKDGTAIVLIVDSESLDVYHFCFEDCPDDTFNNMLKSSN